MVCASVPVICVTLPWKPSSENAWINSVHYHFFTNGKISRWNFILSPFCFCITCLFLAWKRGLPRTSAHVLYCLFKTCVLFNLSGVLILFQKRLLPTAKLCFRFSPCNTAKLSQPRSNMAASTRREKKLWNSQRLRQKFVWLCTVMWGQSW